MKASNFQFSDPSLEYIEFEENKNFVCDNDSENIFIQTNMKKDVKMVSKNEAVVKISIKIGMDDKMPPFKLQAVISAVFKWDDTIEEKLRDVFLKQNAPALLTSYLRPIISMVTNASKYPAYNLPFINFVNE